MLFKKFLDTKLNTITICEDTCIFPDNFKQIIRTINNYFITNVFDIFICSKKNISKEIEDVKIQNIKLFNNIIFIDLVDLKTEDLVKIDMLPFNIFSRNFAQKYIEIYDKIANNIEKTMENIINIMLNYNISYVTTNINYFNNINSTSLLN
jgi:GR25 family glycosyltransferase involved in LPS biosynthesis